MHSSQLSRLTRRGEISSKCCKRDTNPHFNPNFLRFLVVLLTILIFLAENIDGVAVESSQWKVLQMLKVTWKKPMWWRSNTIDCSLQTGLTCDANGNIVQINLSSSKLWGPLPLGLANLKNLQQLRLSGNSISSVPFNFKAANLQSLMYLDLSSNLISGKFPAPFLSLPKIQYLLMSKNFMSGALPDGLGKLKTLIFLVLDSNSFSGNITSSLGNLPVIRRLVLSYNKFTGTVPTTFGKLKSIQTLYISANQLSGPLPYFLANCRALQGLVLSANKFSGPIPSLYYKLTQLITLDLRSNSLSGLVPEIFSGMHLLQFLYLNQNLLAGPLPKSFSSLNSLTEVFLWGNAFWGPLPASIGKMTQLRNIQVHKNQFTGPLPSSMESLPQLTNFNAQNNYLTGTLPAFAITTTVLVSQNCFAGLANQKPDSDCEAFCNTTSPLGACCGVGYCRSVNFVPACGCFPGYTNTAARQDICIKGSARHPPPPKGPVFNPTKGFIPSRINFTYLNPYFKFASYQYVPSSGIWKIDSSKDWRSSPDVEQEVKDQMTCAGCWAFAAVSAFESIYAIVTESWKIGTVPNLSEQQVMDCQTNLLNNCSGGWPGAAFNYISQIMGKLSSESAYPYLNQDGLCQKKPNPTPALGPVFFEQIDFYGWFGLLLALMNQPVVVFVHGSYPSFQNYGSNTGIYIDLTCDQFTIDHTVVAVGYTLSSTTPFWILRNSWGTQWGEKGYMRMWLIGGAGICGMHVLPPQYPSITLVDPCSNPVNPCGGGVCITKGRFRNTCLCPAGFRAVLNLDRTSQTCAIIKVCTYLTSRNLCGVGTCVDDALGGYSCVCPPGFTAGNATTGSPVCIWVGGSLSGPQSLTVRRGVTCTDIYPIYSLTRAQFLAQNPQLNGWCGPITPGTVVNVTNSALADTSSACGLWYSWSYNDRCDQIFSQFSLNDTSFTLLNPGIGTCNGRNIQAGQQICVLSGPPLSPPPCTKYHDVAAGETCTSIMKQFGLQPKAFFLLNPGIYCNNLFLSSSTSDASESNSSPSSTQVCVASPAIGAPKCPKGASQYFVRWGDTCPSIVFHAYGGSFTLMLKLNSGFVCMNSRLYVGLRLCTKVPSYY